MTYGIDLPIIIWANGKYINLLNEAINIYNQNSSYILNVIINNLSDE